MVRNWSSLGLFLLKSKVLYLDSSSVLQDSNLFYTDKGYINSLKRNRLSLDLAVVRKRLCMRLMSSFFSSHMMVFFRFTRYSFVFKNTYSNQTSLYFLDYSSKGFPLPVQLNWFLHKNLKYLNYARQLQINLTYFSLNKSPILVFSNFLTKFSSTAVDAEKMQSYSTKDLLCYFPLSKVDSVVFVLGNLFKSVLSFKYYRAITIGTLSLTPAGIFTLYSALNRSVPNLILLSLDLRRPTSSHFTRFLVSQSSSDKKLSLVEYSVAISNPKPKYISNATVCLSMQIFFNFFIMFIIQLRCLLVISTALVSSF